jgi:thioredoxin reductase (NADPH)
LLATIGMHGPFPIAVFHDGRVLVQPTALEIANIVGINVVQDDSTYDLVVIGAGPAGLAAAVGGASEGLRVLVIEPVAHGGQAGTSSMIRNYLGFPSGIAGADLAALAYRQAYSFGAKFLFGRHATDLRRARGIHAVTLDDGTEVHGRAVMLATGVAYRRVGVDRLDGLLGRGVYYGAATTEAPAMRDEDVFVVGGANSAGQAAIYLARFARSVTLVIRGESLAEGMSDYLVNEIDSLPNVAIFTRTEIADARGDHKLQALLLRDRTTGVTREVPASAVFVLIGAIPATDWLPAEIRRDEHGYVVTGERAGDTGGGRSPLETSVEGVFAVGDVRADSIKRVASAVGDGSSVIRYVHTYLAEVTARKQD